MDELFFISAKKIEEIELLDTKLFTKSGIKNISKIISEEELAPKKNNNNSSLTYPKIRPPKIPAVNDNIFLWFNNSRFVIC